jgi:hypothetical protein
VGDVGAEVISLVPISLGVAKRAVRDWHSHHDPMLGHMWSTGAVVDSDLVGAVVVSRPVAPSLQNESKNEFGGYSTLEVTRLACKGTRQDPRTKNVASRLLCAATDAAMARGVIRLVSYTRVDEDGVCYRAAGWVPRDEVTPGRDHTSGNRKLRWLPGFYEPTTEKIDRIRWEWRPPQAIRAVCKCITAMGRWAQAQQTRRAA